VKSKHYEKFLTVDDVAEMLSLTRQRVYRMVRAGELPIVRVGTRAIRFDPEELARWVDDRRVAGASRASYERGERPGANGPLDKERDRAARSGP
jgi:excisionase family DNA binding protein